MSEAEHARALADIANLADQLHHHEGVLDRLELEPGEGFIAARRRPEFTEILGDVSSKQAYPALTAIVGDSPRAVRETAEALRTLVGIRPRECRQPAAFLA